MCAPIVRLNHQPIAKPLDGYPLRIREGHKSESVTKPLLAANNGLRLQDGWVGRNYLIAGLSAMWVVVFRLRNRSPVTSNSLRCSRHASAGLLTLRRINRSPLE
jgi:hypothetical protein